MSFHLKVLCWREAQTWDKMVRKANADISMDQIWGPEVTLK